MSAFLRKMTACFRTNSDSLLLVASGGLFLEGLSFFNAQLLGLVPNIPWPTDVFFDIQNGAYTETIISTFLSTGVLALCMGYYLGGLARVITYALLCVIAGIIFALLVTTLTFNAWAGYHITSIKGLSTLCHQLIPHTRIYHKFFFSLLVGCALPVIFLVNWVHEKLRRDNKALGNAHFANGVEAYQSGFFKKAPESLIIGKKYGVPLYSNGFEHVLVFAPSGSGKTRAIAMPNLFNYPYSIVCNDIKFTLFQTTSGYRERMLGHTCYCWALTNPHGTTHRFNPLSGISSDKLMRMADIQRVAHILIPDTGKETAFWAQTSRKLFKALVLYLLDTHERPTTLGEINRLVKQPNFDGWFAQVLNHTEHYDAECYRNGVSYLNNEDRTRNNILESFSGHFELFDDPIIDSATSATDFDISQLRREKITIYIGFSEDDMARLAPLLTLFWQQVLSAMIRNVPNLSEEPYPLLCLIDEFSSLGRIEELRRSLKLLREYRVRCLLMFQYIAQTHERYSHDEARAFTNIKTKIAYTSEDLNDAQWVSNLLGTRTKRVNSHSVSNQHNGMSDSSSVSYQAIPLMRPEELMALKPSQSLIMRAGCAPIKATQFIWYKQVSMKHLPMGSSFVPTHEIITKPFVREDDSATFSPKKDMALDEFGDRLN